MGEEEEEEIRQRLTLVLELKAENHQKFALFAGNVTVVPHSCQRQITERIHERELTCPAQLLAMAGKGNKTLGMKDQRRDTGTGPIKKGAQPSTTLLLSE